MVKCAVHERTTRTYLSCDLSGVGAAIPKTVISKTSSSDHGFSLKLFSVDVC